MVRLAGEIGNSSTSLGDEQYSGGGVPGIQAEFPERLKAATGDRAEIEGRRTVPANTMRSLSKFPVIIHVRAVASLLGRKAGAPQAFRQRLNSRHMYALLVEVS